MTPAIRLLEKRGISHTVTQYELAASGGSYGLHAAQTLGLEAASVFKTLIAELDSGALVVAVVPVDATLDLKALAKAAGARKAQMADHQAAERATGYVVGGISPLGQKKHLATFIDKSAEQLAQMHISGGKRGLEISLAPADLLTLAQATSVAIAKHADR